MIAFSSSRTLPGQVCRSRACIASEAISVTRRAAARSLLLEEVHGQQRDVLGPLAQRGQVDPDHVEPVEQVGAESALLDLILQDLVGGRDDPDVDLERLRPADALELPGLEHAEQLGLEGRGDVADLVEQQRPAVGQLEPADLAPLGAREGALLVTEQLALQQRVVRARRS